VTGSPGVTGRGPDDRPNVARVAHGECDPTEMSPDTTNEETVGTDGPLDAPGVSVSSATVRAEMAALEREGYLAQPHTSAGRIPTDKGYRFFVDHLDGPGPLDPARRLQVRQFFDHAHGEIEQMLERTSGLLADLTDGDQVQLLGRQLHCRRSRGRGRGGHAAFSGLVRGFRTGAQPQARHRNDRRRTPPRTAFDPLLANHQCVSLVPHKILPGLDAPEHPLTDYAETAALIAGLDLVITVDTSVAHVAGALGRPAWVLLPHAPDWRWLLHRNDTPWYSSLRLFRQPKPGDWRSVIADVVTALAARA